VLLSSASLAPLLLLQLFSYGGEAPLHKCSDTVCCPWAVYYLLSAICCVLSSDGPRCSSSSAHRLAIASLFLPVILQKIQINSVLYCAGSSSSKIRW
jgi:hypothetical protein